MIALGSDDERNALEEVLRMPCDEIGNETNRALRFEALALDPLVRHHLAELALQLVEEQQLVVGYQTARARLLAKRMADSIRETAPLVASLLRARAEAHASSEGAALLGEAWTCHAKPAALGGKTCGHANDKGGERFDGHVCCAGCGATKFASDARRERGRESGGEA